LISVFPKNTGGTRARITNSDRKRIEGGFFKLRLTVKAKEIIHIQTRARFSRCWDVERLPFTAEFWSPNGAAFFNFAFTFVHRLPASCAIQKDRPPSCRGGLRIGS
jgi:hypothetical protein